MSAEVNVRNAVEKDVPKLLSLFFEANDIHTRHLSEFFRRPSEGFVRELLIENFGNKDARVFVAEVDGQVIGYARAVIKSSPETEMNLPGLVGRLDEIVVSERSRGTGVGTQLLKAVENWVREKGVGQIELNVWAFNEEAERFYIAQGYGVSRTIYAKELN